MRRKLTQAMALGMAAMMTVGMLAGCGGKKTDNGESESGSKTETSSESGDSSEASADTLNPAGTYPIVKDGTLDMSLFTMSMPNVEDFATNDFTKFMEEKTGIHFEFITGGRDDWEDKLNMLFQSDDYPDVIFGVGPNIAKYGVKEQILIPLDDYLTEENVPNYLAMMEKYGYDIGVTRETDGQIYSLVNVNDCFHCKYARKMWVNTYYLEQMGCEIPTTTDEFIDVCKKFLEMKPDGIAVAGAETGWFTRMQDWLMQQNKRMNENI